MARACAWARIRADVSRRVGDAAKKSARRAASTRATSGDDASSSSSSSSSGRWEELEQIYLCVFDLDDPEREAIYTTSRRDDDRAVNAFVCFETMDDALRAAMAISEVARDMPAVDSAPPAALTLLSMSAGYEVEFVPRGAPFEVPSTIIDETTTIGRDDLAMSADDLAAYLSGGGRAASADDESVEDDAESLRSARAEAAMAMRDALRAPARRVRDATASSARAPVAGARTYIFSAKSAVAAILAAARAKSAGEDRGT